MTGVEGDAVFVMSLALSTGALGLGAAISVLGRWGMSPTKILPAMVMLLMVAELMLTARHPLPSIVPWCLVAFMSAGTVATYSITAAVFEKSVLGRVNGAINLFHIGGAFVIQFAAGLIICRWEPTGPGRYPVIAYTVMLISLILMQAVALVWYLRSPKSGNATVTPLAEPLPT